MTIKHIQLNTALYQYLLENSLRENEHLKSIREYTQDLPNAMMEIAPDQGQFMQLLLKLMNAKKVIELGVFTGYSSLAMALALPDDGEIIACDISKEWTDIAKHYWEEAGVSQKITLKLAPAIDTLKQLLSENKKNTFDAVFIDADKVNYLDYYELSLELIRSGGLIIIDNTLRDGGVINSGDTSAATAMVKKLNAKLHDDQRIDMIMLPVADGLTLVVKR